MAKKSGKQADDWSEAKRRCRISDEEVRMAKELGISPRSLIKNIPAKSQPWKAPVREWIRELHTKRFGESRKRNPKTKPPPQVQQHAEPTGPGADALLPHYDTVDKEPHLMDFFEVVNSRRSVRQYLPEPVPRDVLQRIVAAGVEAPSGCNLQLRQYLIVDDSQLLDRIRPVSKSLTGATAAVVLLVEPRATSFGMEFWVQDASAAMENMLLAAVVLGYAGCWVEGALRRSEDLLRKELGVPDSLRVWSLMPVGKPVAVLARPDKPKADDITHYNRYGQRQ